MGRKDEAEDYRDGCKFNLMQYESAFKAIDNILRQEAGCSNLNP